MEIVSAPHWFEYLEIADTFQEQWKDGLSTDWIAQLDDGEDADNYWCWPSEWRAAYDNAVAEYHEKISKKAKAGTLHKCGNTKLYELEEEFFISTPSFDHGTIAPLSLNEKSGLDSLETAFYAFINDYAEWEGKHGKNWEMANILSSADQSAQTDAVICEICGTTFSLRQDDNLEICRNCR